MSHEAEMPGVEVTEAVFQMICYRYYTAGKLVPEKQVLEVGCGAGLGLGYLSRKAKRVVGGDYAEDNLRCAQRHYGERAELVRLDAHKLPLKNDSFDVVVAVEVLQYLHLDEFLDECYRILKSEGILLLCIPNKDRPDFQPSSLSSKYYSAPELFDFLNHHNFDSQLFGAFPVIKGSARLAQKIRQNIIAVGVKTLNLLDFMPGMRENRGLVKKLVGYKTLVLTEEIKDEDIEMVENIQLVPLCCDSPHPGYTFLYGIARANKSPFQRVT